MRGDAFICQKSMTVFEVFSVIYEMDKCGWVFVREAWFNSTFIHLFQIWLIVILFFDGFFYLLSLWFVVWFIFIYSVEYIICMENESFPFQFV